jgi:Ca2+-transporting ATPase
MPRASDEPLFSAPLVLWSLVQGTLALGLVGLIFIVANMRGMPEDEVRALAFFSLVLAIISLIFVNRSFSSSLVSALRPNQALAWIVLTVATVLALSLVWPFARDLFRFGPLHGDDLLLTAAAAVFVFIVLEALKPLLSARVEG